MRYDMCDFFGVEVQLMIIFSINCLLIFAIDLLQAILAVVTFWGNGELKNPKWKKAIIILVLLKYSLHTRDTAWFLVSHKTGAGGRKMWMNCVNLLSS